MNTPGPNYTFHLSLEPHTLSVFLSPYCTSGPLCHTDTSNRTHCLLLHIVPPPSAQSLEWAQIVSGHITLRLHHIPSVSLATRCPLTTKATLLCHPPVVPYQTEKGKPSSRSCSSAVTSLCFLVQSVGLLWNNGSRRDRGSGRCERGASESSRAEFGKRRGFLSLKGWGQVTQPKTEL